jgi:hypothetical protein
MSESAALFRDIVAEHGGKSAFDAIQLGAARRLAQVLSEDADINAAIVSTLSGMLPPKAPIEPSPDLTRLTDRQLAALDSLMAVAHGERPPAPERPAPRRKSRSRRQVAADDLAVLCDQIEAETQSEHRRASDDEMREIKNGLIALLPLAVNPLDLWPEQIDDMAHRLAADLAKAELAKAAESPAPAPTQPPAPAPSPSPSPSPWRGFGVIRGGARSEEDAAHAAIHRTDRGVW